jgi:hypothetical protein
MADALHRAAAVLRDADATEAQQQAAWQDARDTLAAANEQGLTTADYAGALPDFTELSAEEREQYAEQIDDLAAQLGARAAAQRQEGRPTGAHDSGGEGDFDIDLTRVSFTPFPPPDQVRFEADSTLDLAVQSSARRALAQRAVDSLEN